MKHITYYTSALLFALFCTNANSQDLTAYANTIIGQNITNYTHSINTTVFDMTSTPSFTQSNHVHETTPFDLYGTMPTYGEYNDDGTIGRNGGDTNNATLNNIWINWQTSNNKTKFENTAILDNRSNIIIAGITGNTYNIGKIKNTWGLYTGYTGGDQENKHIDIDEQGGIFGVFNKFSAQNLNILTTLNAGTLNNNIKTSGGSDKTTNFWIDGATMATYDISLDPSFIVRPALYAEYTWIKSDDYTSYSGAIINNENLHKFEISPRLSLIKHIANNWVANANVKYIINLNNDGTTIVNKNKIEQLDIDNYFEYGLSINKTVKNFNFNININRQDGAIYGWSGGMNFKYIF